MLHHFLINPAAGKGNLTDSLGKAIIRACEAKQVDYRIHTTTRPGDATFYVRSAVSENPGVPQRFYACGGDGTLSETVNGAPLAGNVEFAVIPIGTGNDFERNFTGPEYFRDIERQIDGTPVRLDLLRYNDRYSVNMINIGFDCNVVIKVGEIKRSPLVPSKMAYIAGVGITLFKKMSSEMHISLPDGTVIDRSLLLTAIGNGAWCGGGFLATPKADPTDGLMDICAIDKVSRAKFLSFVGDYRAGRHIDNPATESFVHYYRVPHAEYHFSSPAGICVDGEVELTDHVTLDVIPQAFSFSVPRGSSLRRPAIAETAPEEATV